MAISSPMRVITTSAEIHLIVKWICCQIDLFKCLIFVLQSWSWSCLFFLLRLSQGNIFSFPPCCRCSPSTDLISGRQPLGSSSGSWKKNYFCCISGFWGLPFLFCEKVAGLRALRRWNTRIAIARATKRLLGFVANLMDGIRPVLVFVS